MGFTRSTTVVNVHSTLGDFPAEDNHLTAAQLKERFDSPATGLKTDLNGLMTELEASTSAASVGAATLNESDVSSANVQAKLNKIYTELLAVKSGGVDSGSIATGKIADGAITTAKIANSNVTTGKIADGNVTTAKLATSSVTSAKINDGAVTSTKMSTDAKKAENLTATAMYEGDESDGNIQAKLNSLAADVQQISQQGVADNSISTAKIQNSAVTANKLASSAITSAKVASSAITSTKIADGNVTEAKLASSAVTNAKMASGAVSEDKVATNFGLVPKGLICMWSGSSVPSGWYLCNGQNGTPDLRDKFIVGSGSTYSIGNTGGSASVSVTASDLPKHSHQISLGSGKYTGSGGSKYGGIKDSSNGLAVWDSEVARVSSGSTKTYTRFDSDTTGTSDTATFENRPPYYALAFIMKG